MMSSSYFLRAIARGLVFFAAGGLTIVLGETVFVVGFVLASGRPSDGVLFVGSIMILGGFVVMVIGLVEAVGFYNQGVSHQAAEQKSDAPKGSREVEMLSENRPVNDPPTEASPQVRRAATRSDRPVGLDEVSLVLWQALLDEDRPVSSRELAKAAGVDFGATVSGVQELAQLGYCSRSESGKYTATMPGNS